MPVLIWFIDLDPDGHDTRFLGACAYADREEYRAKLHKLCEAMGWATEPALGLPRLRPEHCYLGRLPNPFRRL